MVFFFPSEYEDDKNKKKFTRENHKNLDHKILKDKRFMVIRNARERERKCSNLKCCCPDG